MSQPTDHGEPPQPGSAALLALLTALMFAGVALASLAGAYWYLNRGYFEHTEPAVVLAVASPVFVPCAVLAVVALVVAGAQGLTWAFLGQQAKRLVRLRFRRQPTQCAYCHDAFAPAARVHVCPGCAASLHVECLEEAQGCTSLGCGAAYRVEAPQGQRGGGDPESEAREKGG